MIEPIKLSTNDENRLIGMKENLELLDEELRKAERAGLDVTELREKFNKSKQVRDGILREYGSQQQ